MAEFTVLARKYRPHLFSEVVGQEHIVKAMKNSITNNSLHSVYLLSGTRGVGKTTLARIFAKSMNCQNFAHSLEPCGECESCKAIDDNSCVDLIEIDGASKTKVEDTRDLIESLNYPPIFSKYKIFIIDEVHMLTTQSFNALLKTLEEPPEYAKFLLCTTDPQKIPATVLSRCLHFHLKPYTPNIIAHQLKFILEQENIEFDEKSIVALSEAANGSLRDCLSLSEQAIAICNRKLNYKQVYEMLGLIDDSLAFELVQAILGQNSNTSINNINFENDKLSDHLDEEMDHSFDLILNKLEEISSLQTDWKIVVNQICYVLYQISLFDFVDNKELIKNQIDANVFSYYEHYPHLNNEFFTQLQNTFDLFINCNKLLEFTTNPYQLVSLTCMRALAFAKEEKKKQLVTKLEENNTQTSIFKSTYRRNLKTNVISRLPKAESSQRLSFLHDLQFTTVKPRSKPFKATNVALDDFSNAYLEQANALKEKVAIIKNQVHNSSQLDIYHSNSVSNIDTALNSNLNSNLSSSVTSSVVTDVNNSNNSLSLFKSVYSQNLNHLKPVNTFKIVVNNGLTIGSNSNEVNTVINANLSTNVESLSQDTNILVPNSIQLQNGLIPTHISQNSLSHHNINLQTEVNKVLKNIEFKQTSYYKIYDKYEQSVELLIDSYIAQTSSVFLRICLESLLKLYHNQPSLFNNHIESLDNLDHTDDQIAYQLNIEYFIKNELVEDKMLTDLTLFKSLAMLNLSSKELNCIVNKQICLNTDLKVLTILVPELELTDPHFKEIYQTINSELEKQGYTFVTATQQNIDNFIELVTLTDMAYQYVETQLQQYVTKFKQELNNLIYILQNF